MVSVNFVSPDCFTIGFLSHGGRPRSTCACGGTTVKGAVTAN